MLFKSMKGLFFPIIDKFLWKNEDQLILINQEEEKEKKFLIKLKNLKLSKTNIDKEEKERHLKNYNNLEKMLKKYKMRLEEIRN